jgi:hypothetical protein
MVAHARQPVKAGDHRPRTARHAVRYRRPFAETNEPLGGFILIEARDPKEAIRVASKIPLPRRGNIEGATDPRDPSVRRMR